MKEGILRYNAERCANAKGAHCDCPCRGTLHGKPHEESWIKSILANGRPALPGDSIQLSDLFKEKK